MQLPNNLTELNEVWAKAPQEKIAKSISILLLCYLAYLCAQMTWSFMTPVQKNDFSTKGLLPKSVNKQSAVELNRLTALNLFGQFNAIEEVKEVVVQDAPETDLRLTLAGTVASDKPETAAAIIANNGKQETYGVGDKIAGTRATLDSVAMDRVIIKRLGRLETLMLDGIKYSKSSQINQVKRNHAKKETKPRSGNKQVVDQRNNRQLTREAQKLKNDLKENPAKLTDYLRISPRRKGGSIIGYQLMPGKKPEFFKSSGLKSGDIAVQMNGLDLTIPQESMQALKALREETELSLLVDRDGEMTEILFSIENNN